MLLQSKCSRRVIRVFIIRTMFACGNAIIRIIITRRIASACFVIAIRRRVIMITRNIMINRMRSRILLRLCVRLNIRIRMICRAIIMIDRIVFVSLWYVLALCSQSYAYY